MELSENSQSISGWLQNYDDQMVHQTRKPINQLTINQKQLSMRSISMCQHQQDQEQYKSSNKYNIFDLFLKIRNSNQQIVNNNNKISELKRIMEFLSVNEQSKYDAHQRYQRQPDYQEDNQAAIQLHQAQFKIKLKQRFQVIEFLQKQMLQPLYEIHQINAQTERQLNCRSNNLSQKGTHLKTDNHQDILKSTSIQRLLSKRDVKPRITKQLNEMQSKQKELELLQLMIKKHRENVQQYFPKKNRYLR